MRRVSWYPPAAIQDLVVGTVALGCFIYLIVAILRRGPDSPAAQPFPFA